MEFVKRLEQLRVERGAHSPISVADLHFIFGEQMTAHAADLEAQKAEQAKAAQEARAQQLRAELAQLEGAAGSSPVSAAPIL